MKRAVAVQISVLIALFTPIRAQEPYRKASTIAITHVNIVDTNGGRTRSEMTVTLREGKIADIGKSSKILIPADSIVVNGKGKFLIPGLSDMHIHWHDVRYFPLFIANGVTNV